MKPFIAGLIAGLFYGASLGVLIQQNVQKHSFDWQKQWQETRDLWLKDRQDWASGKPFVYNYGRFHEKW